MATQRNPIATHVERQWKPRELVEVVGRELRGSADQNELVALRENPQRWLGVLGVVLNDIQTQIGDRTRMFESELGRPMRSPTFKQTEAEHGAWMRKARHFERLVRVRIADVRRLVPEDDLWTLLVDGCDIPLEDPVALRVWQDHVRKVLVHRAPPGFALPPVESPE